MCGICGIADFHKGLEAGAEHVSAMNDTLAHRGPDDSGVFSSTHAALAMRRLSVIDIHGGHQPMSSPDGLVTIVYNGETYNYREIRDELSASGYEFKTSSDTEAVLALYLDRGVDCLTALNGMFAFAIHDARENVLLLARDRLGVKPLYYHDSPGRICFASEIKALLAHPDVPRRIDMPSLGHYLAHLYVPGDRTIFEEIRSLPPGCYIRFDGEEPEPVRYWDVNFSPSDTGMEDAVAHLDELLNDAVRMNLVSDVPIGSFLSGGIDSSLVTALMCSHAGGRVKTFSIGFAEEQYDERRYARMVAERYSTDHSEFVVEYPGMPDFLPRLARCFDQPFADAAALPAFVLAENARKSVTVALSGNGGDELFGGYTKYLAEYYNAKLSFVPASLRAAALSVLENVLPESPGLRDRNRRIKRLLRYSLEPAASRPVTWTTGFGPAMQQNLLTPETRHQLDVTDAFAPWLDVFTSSRGADMLSRQQYTDIKLYLPDNNLLKDDITGMANSLETRVPLLDHRVAEFAASLPHHMRVDGTDMKSILKKVAAKYLPAELINRPKQGFTVPVGEWIKGSLAEYADDMLSPGSPGMSYFEQSEIRKLLYEHRAGHADHGMRLWALIVFGAWHSVYFK